MTSQTAVWSLLTQPQETCQQRRGRDLGIDASWRLASDQLAGTMVSPQSHGSVPRPRLGRPYAHHCLRVTAHSSQLSLQSLLRLTIRPSLTTNDHYCPHWHWSQGCHWPLLTTTDHYWPLQTTTDHQRALLTITDPWWPMLLTTIDHYWSLQTTTDDYRPPKSTTDHHWPLMTNATDHYKPPVTTTDYYRLLLTSTDHYWPLLTTTDYYWPLQTTTDHYRPLLITTDHYWSLQTTTDHYRASLTTTDYYWPLQTTKDHYWSLLITTDHYRPLLTTTEHRWPLQTTTDHGLHVQSILSEFSQLHCKACLTQLNWHQLCTQLLQFGLARKLWRLVRCTRQLQMSLWQTDKLTTTIQTDTRTHLSQSTTIHSAHSGSWL